jgi:toxin ParE1/3/4
LKPAKLRPSAEDDLVQAARHYAHEEGVALGERMFDAALNSLKPIERMPQIGSPRQGQLCDIPGLRSGRVDGFPELWVYFEADDHIDVVRLMGDRQDIVAILTTGLINASSDRTTRRPALWWSPPPENSHSPKPRNRRFYSVRCKTGATGCWWRRHCRRRIGGR